MNPKIFVGAVVVAMIAILMIFALPGASIISDIGEQGFLSPSTQEQTVLPINIELYSVLSLIGILGIFITYYLFIRRSVVNSKLRD